MTLKIGVIDGQGGGIGRALLERLSSEAALLDSVSVCALGTNADATRAMVSAAKGFAIRGVTGEEAILGELGDLHIVVGSVGILAAGAMKGELTAQIARCVAECGAEKLLIPLNRCNMTVAGANRGMSYYIGEAVSVIVGKLSGD